MTTATARRPLYNQLYGKPEDFIEDFLPFVNHWKYNEVERTLREWLAEGKLDGELTREQGQLLAHWQRKPEKFDRNRSRYIPRAVRLEVLERDGRKCVECSGTEDITLDHIKPFIKGGSHEAHNLRVLCRPCNSRKGAR